MSEDGADYPDKSVDSLVNELKVAYEARPAQHIFTQIPAPKFAF